MCGENGSLINEAEIVIEVSDLDKKILEIIAKSVSPENKLAPPGVTINQKLNSKLVFTCMAKFKLNPRLKVSSLRRTIDDLIASMMVTFNSIKAME